MNLAGFFIKIKFKNFNRLANSILESLDMETDPCKYFPSILNLYLKKFNITEKHIHISIGENFYQFTCGNFLKNKRIPEDQSRVDVFDMLRYDLAYEIADLLSVPIEPSDIESIKKAKDLYNSCMDEGCSFY